MARDCDQTEDGAYCSSISSISPAVGWFDLAFSRITIAEVLATF